MIGLFVTALYTFRMIFMTFHGPERLDHHTQEHFHDVGWDMKGPLVALAIPSLLIGAITVGPVLFGGYFGDSIRVLDSQNVVGELGREWTGAANFGWHGFLSLPMYIAAAGVFTAWVFVLKKPEWGDLTREHLALLYRILVNKYYFDWFNENVIAPLTRGIGFALWRDGDQLLIDGAAVNGSAETVGWAASCYAPAAERLSVFLRFLDGDRARRTARLVVAAMRL